MKRLSLFFLVILLSFSFAYAEQYTSADVVALLPCFSDSELKAIIESAKLELGKRVALESQSTYTTLEELNATISDDVANTISAISAERSSLLMNVNSYTAYSNNSTTVEEFYKNILSVTEDLCVRLRQYSIDYVKFVLDANKNKNEMYEDLGQLYESIYEDAGQSIYSGVYDGILKSLYDDYYDGILAAAYDSVPYAEWASIRSDEYACWSDARSDTYSEWSDCRTEIYRFWSDIRSAVWSGDIEKANEELNDFQTKVQQMIID